MDEAAPSRQLCLVAGALPFTRFMVRGLGCWDPNRVQLALSSRTQASVRSAAGQGDWPGDRCLLGHPVHLGK